MEEMYSAIGMPFSLGSLIYDGSVIEPCVKVTAIELIANSPTLLSNPSLTKLPLVSIVSESKFHNINNLPSEFRVRPVAVDEEIDERDNFLKLVIENGNSSSICGDKYIASEVNSEINALNSINIEKKIENIETGKNQFASFQNMPVLIREDEEQSTSKRSKQIGFDFVPLWGVNSIRGRMLEMEDSVTTLPLFLRVPIQMLTDEQISHPSSQNLSHLQAHFFGVYDGHGGSQVYLVSVSFVTFTFLL